jgi:hypothetical protein
MLIAILAFVAAFQPERRDNENHKFGSDESLRDRAWGGPWRTNAIRRAQRALDGVDLPFIL